MNGHFLARHNNPTNEHLYYTKELLRRPYRWLANNNGNLGRVLFLLLINLFRHSLLHHHFTKFRIHSISCPVLTAKVYSTEGCYSKPQNQADRSTNQCRCLIDRDRSRTNRHRGHDKTCSQAYKYSPSSEHTCWSLGSGVSDGMRVQRWDNRIRPLFHLHGNLQLNK